MFNFKEMMNGFNFEQVEEGELALTMNGGIAVRRNDGEYVTYDPQNKTVLNNHGFVIDEMDGMFMIIPSPTIEQNDIVKISNDYYFIDEVKNNKIYAINLSSGATSRVNLMKEVSIMGFNFYNKVISLANGFGGNNMNPMSLLMMKEMVSSKNNDSNMFSKIMEMQLMSQMFNNNSSNQSNVFNNIFGGFISPQANNNMLQDKQEETVTLSKTEYEELIKSLKEKGDIQ